MDLNRIVEKLSGVPGVQAVVLGGSRSRGEATANSDYDFGLYYSAGTLDTAQLGRCLQELDDEHRAGLLNAPGQWGPWINGGAWLTVDCAPVDVLLRELGRVRGVLSDCLAGQITIDYQCGHPFAFVNLIYAAEVHFCQVLWQDGARHVDALKALLAPDGGYPLLMREAVVRKFLWEAEFSLACGRKPVLAGETNYAMGTTFRAVCAWVEVLYALNGKYLMNEKGAVRHLGALQVCPADMERRVNEAYGLIASRDAGRALALLDGLHREVASLAEEMSQTAMKMR